MVSPSNRGAVRDRCHRGRSSQCVSVLCCHRADGLIRHVNTCRALGDRSVRGDLLHPLPCAARRRARRTPQNSGSAWASSQFRSGSVYCSRRGRHHRVDRNGRNSLTRSSTPGSARPGSGTGGRSVSGPSSARPIVSFPQTATRLTRDAFARADTYQWTRISNQRLSYSKPLFGVAPEAAAHSLVRALHGQRSSRSKRALTAVGVTTPAHPSFGRPGVSAAFRAGGPLRRRRLARDPHCR